MASLDYIASALADIADTGATQPSASARTYNATVQSVSDDGTVYVTIDGSDAKTPATTTVACSAGQRVTVQIAEHVCTVTGNITSPSTDDTAAETAQETADAAAETAASAVETANAAQSAADSAAETASAAYSNAAYGTCSTAAGTAAKTVECDGFELSEGACVRVSFSTANTYVSGSLTLDVNGTGAKAVYVQGITTSASNELVWTQGATATFQYNGTGWALADSPGTYTGTCPTAAGTAAKTSSIRAAVFQKGAIVTLQCTYANAAAKALTFTAYYNSTTYGVSKTVYYGGGATSTSNPLIWSAGDTIELMWTGSAWRVPNTVSSTIVRQTTSGVELAKRVAGTYTGVRTLLDSNGMHITDADDSVAYAEFTASGVTLRNSGGEQIWAASDEGVVSFGGDYNVAGIYDDWSDDLLEVSANGIDFENLRNRYHLGVSDDDGYLVSFGIDQANGGDYDPVMRVSDAGNMSLPNGSLFCYGQYFLNVGDTAAYAMPYVVCGNASAKTTSTSSAVSVDIDYGVTFKGNPIVACTPYGSSSDAHSTTCVVASHSTTGCTVSVKNTAATGTWYFDWVAVGVLATAWPDGYSDLYSGSSGSSSSSSTSSAADAEVAAATFFGWEGDE